MKTTANINQVKEALSNVNKAQGYQLEFNRLDQSGKWVNFTLQTKSKIPGSRTSWSGRNLAKASWHAHGYFFDELLKLNPACVIVSLKKKIDVKGGNWEDIRIGSMNNPVMFSQTSIL